jgi:hypothetical protein
LPLCDWAPLAAIVLCFSANCSTNDGVDTIFLTMDMIAMLFGVFALLFSCLVVDEVKFVV